MDRLLPVSHYPTGFRVTYRIADYIVGYMLLKIQRDSAN